MKQLAAAALLSAALLAGCGGSASTRNARPALQRQLDALVTGAARVAPGASAYVSGPKGTWTGAAGWSNTAGRLPAAPDMRGRLGSISKLWTATVVVKLAEEHKLRLSDTLARWLPGVFPEGGRITVGQLLNHTSGLVDDNDVINHPHRYLAELGPRLRRELLADSKANRIPPGLEIRVAAALPLVAPPGTKFHYSNIGYKVAARIAEKASGEPLDRLYREIIAGPLHLKSYGYDPDGAIAGPHATGYVVQKGGRPTVYKDPTTGFWAASGGVVTDAEDEARFLLGLVDGKILSGAYLSRLEGTTGAAPNYGYGTGVAPLCGSTVLTHGGATTSYTAEVAVATDGSRVAVLLLNGRTYDEAGDAVAGQALLKLLCAA